MKIVLDPNAPLTNFILGAALAGGDPIAAARMVLPTEEPTQEKTLNEEEEEEGEEEEEEEEEQEEDG